MKIEIESPINKYYVQTLCMIFFPGEKFSGDDDNTDEPYLFLKTNTYDDGVISYAKIVYQGNTVEATRRSDYSQNRTKEEV